MPLKPVFSCYWFEGGDYTTTDAQLPIPLLIHAGNMLLKAVLFSWIAALGKLILYL